MASGSCQSCFDPYHLSNDHEQYQKPNNGAETTSIVSDRAACLLTTAWLYLNSLPEAQKNFEQIDPISQITTPT